MIYFKCPFTRSFKSCFELKITTEKGNRESYFSDFSPLPTHFGSNYLFTQQFNYSQNLIDYKRDSALLYDLLYTYSFKNCFKLKITIVSAFRPAGVQAHHYNLQTIHWGKGNFSFMDQRRRILIVSFLNCIQVAFRKKYKTAGGFAVYNYLSR